MRNKFSGICYRCGEVVAEGAGHFERYFGGWRTQHAECAIAFRGTPDARRDAAREARLKQVASGTGRAAQRARRRLRDEQIGSAS